LDFSKNARVLFTYRASLSVLEEVQMSKAFVFGLVTGLALLLGIGVRSSRLTQTDPEEKVFQAELPDATPIKVGVLTERQRAHSKLYSQYREMRAQNMDSITELAAHNKGKCKIVQTRTFTPLGPLLGPDTPENYFDRLARESDAVLLGRPTKKVSQITEDDSFIFTDYDVLIKEVIKNNIVAPLDAGASITITRPGGKVLLDGMIVRAIDDSYGPLPINGNDVLLFLRFVPETGAYRATRETGSFELDGSSVRPLTRSAMPPGTILDSDSFLKTIRSVSRQ
jgi:hypothetical protein